MKRKGTSFRHKRAPISVNGTFITLMTVPVSANREVLNETRSFIRHARGLINVLTLGVLTRKASGRDLVDNWVWTWVGNLLGSALLATLVVRSGVISVDPVKSFVLKVVETKMHLPADQLILRAVLANWLVCLAVWMSSRAKSEVARILLIWWCMFTFITCGYEHSVANMTGLLLGLLLPHGEGITLSGYGYNLVLATLGNIIGGAGFVAGMYWVGSPGPPPESQEGVHSEPAIARAHVVAE